MPTTVHHRKTIMTTRSTPQTFSLVSAALLGVEARLVDVHVRVHPADALEIQIDGLLTAAAAREADLSRLHLRMLARRYGIAAGADKDD